MALEVLSSCSLFEAENHGKAPKVFVSARSNPYHMSGVLHNYAHDIEGLWWIGMWILFHTTTPELAGKLVESDFTAYPEARVDQIFPLYLPCSAHRGCFLRSDDYFDKTTRFLPEAYQPACEVLDEARSALLSFYTNLENPLTNERLQDHNLYAVLYETMAPVFARLAASAPPEDQVYFCDRREELRVLELAQAKAEEEAAEEAARQAKAEEEAAEEAARRTEATEEVARQSEAAEQTKAREKRKRGTNHTDVEIQNADTHTRKKLKVMKSAKASASSDGISDPSAALPTPSTLRTTRSMTRRNISLAVNAPVLRRSTRAIAAKAVTSQCTSTGQRPPRKRRAPA